MPWVFDETRHKRKLTAIAAITVTAGALGSGLTRTRGAARAVSYRRLRRGVAFCGTGDAKSSRKRWTSVAICEHRRVGDFFSLSGAGPVVVAQ